VNLSFINWIWRIKGTLPIEPTQSAGETFAKLDDFFREKNTTYRIEGDTLTFTKKKQHPQDKMSVFDGGTLRVVGGALRYDMMSRALLACFIAPLFFFAVGQIGVTVDKWRNPPEVVKAKAEAAKKRQKVKPEDVAMNPIDQFLGAPQPEKKKKGEEETGKRNRKPSMTTAYVFMGLFFGFWAVGRVLEEWLIRFRFRNKLTGDSGNEITGNRTPVGA